MSRILVGPAGWSYPDWKGKVYPRRAPMGFDELEFIASLFPCVEINTSFYRPPSPRMTEAWARRTPAGFLFSAKAGQEFTHRPQPVSQGDVRRFRESFAPLVQAGKLGAIFLQYPESFVHSASSQERLRRAAEALRGLAPLVVEVRHRSWLKEIGFFRDVGLAFCNVDMPAVGDALTGTCLGQGPVGYVRFHGRNTRAWVSRNSPRDEKYDYLYSPEELKAWEAGIRGLEVENLFVILNNHFQGKAVVNALELRRALGEDPAIPDVLRDAYPDRFGRSPGNLF